MLSHKMQSIRARVLLNKLEEQKIGKMFEEVAWEVIMLGFGCSLAGACLY